MSTKPIGKVKVKVKGDQKLRLQRQKCNFPPYGMNPYGMNPYGMNPYGMYSVLGTEILWREAANLRP